MNRAMTVKRILIMSYAMDACFLVIHIAMFFFFMYFGVKPMMWFNVGSMIFYTAAALLVHLLCFRLFATLVYLEVVLHMSAAVYFVGWGCGFQICLLGMNILLFYSEYLGRAMGRKHIKALLLCPIGLVAYIWSYVVSTRAPAPYTLPDNVCFTLQISLAIVVFAIVIAYLQVFVSVTSRSEAILSNEVLHDKLTGLPNRYYMADYFNQVEGQRGQKKYWIAIADLDDFKKINDTYGHNCGDYVLKTLAKLLTDHSVGAVVCRWGGEEFLISDWVADNGSIVTYDLLNHIRKEISEYQFKYEGQYLRITITIGCAWHKEGQSTAEWVEEADKKLYEGKTSGKNKVVM